MKKVISILLALCMVLSLCAFALADEETKTVGISMPTKSLERWNRDGEYLQEQFEEAGYEVELTYSDNDITQQNNDVANLIADGVDLLIISAINGKAHRVTVNDSPVELTAIQFCLLQELMRSQGCVRSREELLSSVWDYQFEGYDRTVDTHIKRLRARLGECADIIETVGYNYGEHLYRKVWTRGSSFWIGGASSSRLIPPFAGCSPAALQDFPPRP